MDVGSSILHHVERHVNACLTCYVWRHGTHGYQVKTKNCLGIAGFSLDVLKLLSTRLRSHQRALLTGNKCKEIDNTLYDITSNNFDYSQLPQWLLIIVTENDLDVKENINAICRWYRRVKVWGCDCLTVVTALTTPPTKTPPLPLSARIQDLCRQNPELDEMRSRHRLKTFYICHWDSIESTEQVFVDVVRNWLAASSQPAVEAPTQANKDQHMSYTNIIKIVVRDVYHSLPQVEIFFRLFVMCFMGLVSVIATLSVIVLLSKDGGIQKDLHRAQDYVISHLEARRTPRADWGSHTADVITALQTHNHHWCFDNVNNRRSVDRLEIGVLASISKLSPKSRTTLTYSAQKLATDINALLATFQNPRDFYHHDLVAILKRYLSDVIPYTAYTAHAYSTYVIALCNSGDDLNFEYAERIYQKQNKDGGFYLGINEASMSLMALSCISQTEEQIKKTEAIVRYIRKRRRHDSSYGALYSTSLVLQAYNITGIPVDTQARRDVTLSWLLRSCYGNAALKDPVVASAVLLALSGHSLLDISHITGIDYKRHRSALLPSGGQQAKFRYLAPESAPKVRDVRPESRGLGLSDGPTLIKRVEVTERQTQNTTLFTVENLVLNRSRDVVRETWPNKERTDERPTVTADKDGQRSHVTSPGHRWKTWKRKFNDIEEDDDDGYEPRYTGSKIKSRDRFRRRSKQGVTVNEAALEYIFLTQCFV